MKKLSLILAAAAIAASLSVSSFAVDVISPLDNGKDVKEDTVVDQTGKKIDIVVTPVTAEAVTKAAEEIAKKPVDEVKALLEKTFAADATDEDKAKLLELAGVQSVSEANLAMIVALSKTSEGIKALDELFTKGLADAKKEIKIDGKVFAMDKLTLTAAIAIDYKAGASKEGIEKITFTLTVPSATVGQKFVALQLCKDCFGIDDVLYGTCTKAGEVSFTTNSADLCAFVIYTDATTHNSPQTGDVLGVVAVVSALALAGVVISKRRVNG